MGIIDYGSQNISFSYQEPLDSTDFNKLIKNTLKLGVYKGFSVTKIANNNISLSPGVLVISDGTYTIRMETAITTLQPISCSSTLNYIVARWSYINSTSNYVDFLCISSASILSTDVVLGLLVYSGSNLIGVDYSYRVFGNLHRQNAFVNSVDNVLYIDSGTNFWFCGSDDYLIDYVELTNKLTIGMLSVTGINYLMYDGLGFFTTTTLTGLHYDPKKMGWYDASEDRVLCYVFFDGSITITSLNSLINNIYDPIQALNTRGYTDISADKNLLNYDWENINFSGKNVIMGSGQTHSPDGTTDKTWFIDSNAIGNDTTNVCVKAVRQDTLQLYINCKTNGVWGTWTLI